MAKQFAPLLEWERRMSSKERRMGSDQQWYTLHEFQDYYGIDRAARWWEEARREQAKVDVAKAPPPKPEVSNASAAQPARLPPPQPQSCQERGMASDARAVQPVRECLNIRTDVLAPVLAQCPWDADTKTWLIPETMADARLLNMDWSNMLKIHPGANITAVVPTFYQDEPDPNQRDAPRLDIVVSFADGRSVRYHPSAEPIWSDQPQPTKTMQLRYQRAIKLATKLHSA